MGLIKPQRKLWTALKPAVLVPSRRPIPVVRPPIIPMRRVLPARMAVTLDVNGADGTSGGTATTSLSFSGPNITSGLSNSVLLVSVVYGNGSTTVTAPSTLTMGAQTLNQIGTRDNNHFPGNQVAMYGLVAPASGTSTITGTFPSAVFWYAQGSSFKGVNQTGGTTTFANFNGADSFGVTTLGLTITTANNDYTQVAGLFGNIAATAWTGPTNIVNVINDSSLSGSAGFDCGIAQNASTTTSDAYTGHNAANDTLTLIGVHLVAAAAAAVTYTGYDDGQNKTYPQGKMVGWRAAAIARGDDGIQAPFIRFQPNDWDTHPPQPPAPPVPRGRPAAIMVGDQGTQAQFIRFLPNDWDTHPFQPNHPAPERRYAAIVQKDEGIEFPFIRFLPNDWDTHPPQPPHPRPEKVAALFGGDQGSEAQFIRFFPYGWEIPSPQPPHPRPERAGAIMPNEPGIEARFVPPVTLVWGWESPPAFLIRKVRPVPEFGDQGILSQFINFIAYGWEVSPFCPGHPRVEKAASWLTGDQGIEAPFLTWLNAGWEIPSFQPPAYPSPRQRYAGAKGKAQFPIFSTWVNMGWEIPSPQPPHPRPERAGAIAAGDSGIELPFAFVPTTPWGWEVAAPFLRRRLLADPDIGDQGTEASLINWLNAGWEIPPFQPQHPRPERSGAIMPFEPGIEAVYVPPAPIIWGWEIAPHQPVVNIRGRYPGLRGSSQFPIFSTWVNTGWEIPPFQPSHPRIERSGAIALSDQGTQFPFVPPVTIVWGYESASQILRSPPRNSAALWGSSDFAAFTFQPYGWEIPPFQPSHPRPERNAAWLIGDQGSLAQLNMFLPWGWEIPAPFLTNHAVFKKSPEFGDEGIYAPYVFVPPPIITLLLRTLMGYGL